ncbi:glycosyltransferase family 2 protein [Clostridium sp. BL-8]|uniref:glycosyltransferase family 2 protein n=1 Tax=Clostridium sp. BL-8 TaxID=349938 RepID=UPI00098C9A42|nr:glycosyltransferase family 2 protein [Clostridium sp. BL-8]OOM79962.1 putative glycosyltransferase EpsJ [Clostridium sp. BL-8]
MKKISVIVPVYNVEPYVRKCLDSIINQTYKNLEIICIDDGSTDASGKICDEYAKKDLRFQVIHKSNEGNSSALNLGLDIFTGEYVGFVDSDDWIELNYYETLYDEIEKNKADIVCSGYYKETFEKSTVIRNKLSIENGKFNREKILKYTFIRDRYPAFGAYYWNKLFNASFFRAKGNSGYEIRADEELQVGGDVLLFTECALKAKSAIYCELPCYHYFQREDSLFHAKDIEKRKGSLQAYRHVIELLEENKISNEIIIWVKRFYAYHASLLTEIALETNDNKNILLMKNEIRCYITEYIETNKEYPDRIKRINYLLEQEI